MFSSGSLATSKGFTRAESLGVFEQNENYAVIVGINRYESDDIASLRYAVKDAERLTTLFEKQGYQVFTLLNYEASPRRILKQVRKAAALATSGGQEEAGSVVFAFSGHGFRNQKGFNYLATGETELENIEDSGLALKDVKEILRKSGVRQRVMFVDACRNIPGQKNINNRRQGFSLDNEAQGEAVLYSTRAGDLSWEDDQLGHGVFTHYLIEGLAGAAQDDDGIITFDRLQRHVAVGVKRHVARRFDDIQIPYQSGERSSLGEFVLARAGMETTNVITIPEIHSQKPVSIANSLRRTEEIDQLSRRIEKNLSELKLTEPENDNANSLLDELEVIDPSNKLVHAGRSRIRSFYSSWIDKQLRLGNTQKSLEYLSALKLVPGSSAQVREQTGKIWRVMKNGRKR